MWPLSIGTEVKAGLALLVLVGLVLGVVWFSAHERGIGYDQAMAEVKAAAEKTREENRATAQTASAEFAGQQTEIRARVIKTLPEESNALQRPICPMLAPLTVAEDPLAAASEPLRLADLLVPAAIIDGLRRAGADPPDK